MLELSDIRHLPQLDAAVEELLADGPGLALVAGLDPPTSALSASEGLPLPSGRASLFRILTRRLLAGATRRVLVVAPARDAIRVTRDHRRRVEVVAVADAEEVRARMLAVASLPPELVIVQQNVTPAVVDAALQLAAAGSKVLAQLNTPCRGLGAVRELAGAGVSQRDLHALKWIVASQRVPALCVCAALRPVDPLAAAEFAARFPALVPLPAQLRQPVGCSNCGGSGYSGEVFIFDIYRPDIRRAGVSYEEYALGLALDGLIALDDVLSLDAAQLRQAHAMRESSEAALREANAALQRQVAQLETAHRVSTQRTEALLSLQRIGEALLSDATPAELAARLCRQARELCGAERVILYAVQGEQAIALGEAGWGADRLPAAMPATAVCCLPEDSEAAGRPARFDDWPPGIPERTPDLEGAELRAGLRAPLVVQGAVVGALYVHSTVRASFAPGHVALLQTFAAQAALALQRVALTAELRAKVAALEAAQAELAVKARMARELELARQVQESFLPKTFPDAPGFAFGAYSEPAREVGGDFYDVIDLGEGRVGLVIADVSDKGMAAALYMALTRSLIRAEAVREPSPRMVLGNVNRSLLDLGEQGMFVTVFYGVLDTRAGELLYARAGHDYPLLLRDGAATPLDGAGALLGLFDEIAAALTEQSVRLLPGDRLALYTDGLTDVVDGQQRMLGLEGLETILLQQATLSAADFASGVARRLDEYRAGAEQADDMTLLVVTCAHRRHHTRDAA
ncbi:MAG: SpoIIE family protein phosphatase [Anaerolineae bacterium]|jgi:serine phosphatase RsbU (regulator of sigma subunit)|nr:SpoIIE family protein phosphatase [Anaerolineae bacterium]